MTDNTLYWQNFPASSNILNSNILSQSESQWQQDLTTFDFNSTPSPARQPFHNDGYNSSEYNEGDSPESTHERNEPMDIQLSSNGGGDQKERRKEQNRAAQRAFRERKERFVKELQLKIKDMEAKHKDQVSGLISENQSLKEKVKQMEAEIYTLKGAAMAFDVSIHKLREAQQPKEFDVGPLSPPNDDDAPRKQTHHPAPFFASPRKSPTIRDGLFNAIDNSYEEHENFAQPETKRFDHTPDPITLTGAKLIPYTQIWEKLSEHPNFDEFDMNELCEELKKKARCSGTGPVIPETELNVVLKRMDAGNK